MGLTLRRSSRPGRRAVRLRFPDGRTAWVTAWKVQEGQVFLSFDGFEGVAIEREELIDREPTRPAAQDGG